MNQQILAPIAAHLAEWEIAHVELAIHGTGDSRYITHALEEFCRRALGCTPVETLFYRSSVSAVAGLRLSDDRKVVLKAHQPDWSSQRLQEAVRLQSLVATSLGLAPHVIVGRSLAIIGLSVVRSNPPASRARSHVRSAYAFYESDVPIDGVPQQRQCRLIRRTRIGSSRLLEAVEFYEHRALQQSRLAHLGGHASSQHAPTSRLERRTGELRICSESVGPSYLAIKGDPICFDHEDYSSAIAFALSKA